MAKQYRGEITNFEVSPVVDGIAVLQFWVSISIVRSDIELGDEGPIAMLEEKYPFIAARRAYVRVKANGCILEEDGNGEFRYVAFLAVNSAKFAGA